MSSDLDKTKSTNCYFPRDIISDSTQSSLFFEGISIHR